MANASALSRRKAAQRSDGAATRAKILESAGELFGAQGFGSTTSKAVAKRAGVDLASINYHFGSRDGLYEAVLVDAHRRFIALEELHTIAALEVEPEEKLRRLIQLLAARFASHGHWSGPVLVREMLNQSSHIDVLIEREVPPKLAVVLGILHQITGIPAGDPALVRCFISTMAPCMILYLAQGSKPSRLLRIQPDAMADHLYRFAIAGLKAMAAMHGEPSSPSTS